MFLLKEHWPSNSPDLNPLHYDITKPEGAYGLPTKTRESSEDLVFQLWTTFVINCFFFGFCWHYSVYQSVHGTTFVFWIGRGFTWNLFLLTSDIYFSQSVTLQWWHNEFLFFQWITIKSIKNIQRQANIDTCTVSGHLCYHARDLTTLFKDKHLLTYAYDSFSRKTTLVWDICLWEYLNSMKF